MHGHAVAFFTALCAQAILLNCGKGGGWGGQEGEGGVGGGIAAAKREQPCASACSSSLLHSIKYFHSDPFSYSPQNFYVFLG